MEKIKEKIIVIVGPTASGKTDLSLRLAKKFKGEIISADSRQVYKGLDIGTGKVTKKEQKNIPHYLLDVANPKNVFNVSDFKKLGREAIQKILKKKKIPIIVGGTGLYVDSLVYDHIFPEVPPNKKLRARLENLSAEQLFEELKKLDPKRAEQIDQHNPRRLIRAIEIIKATGKPIGPLSKNETYESLWLGLNPKNRDKSIKRRVEKRFKNGMINEVQKLLKNRKLTQKRLLELGLSYRLIAQYLAGELDLKKLKEEVTKTEIQYAKRQMTWFKRNKEILWIQNVTKAQRLIDKFLNEG